MRPIIKIVDGKRSLTIFIEPDSRCAETRIVFAPSWAEIMPLQTTPEGDTSGDNRLTGVDIFPSVAALIDDVPGRSVDAACVVFGGPAMLVTVSTLPDTSDEADILG